MADKKVLPNFIICGTQKGGTSSLYYYLREHPQICMAEKAEVHYFDNNYNKDLSWYTRYFNCSENCSAVGESSPSYMYLEEVPERIYNLLPNAKLIFILRNPVDRAYSHYWHAVKRGGESLTFEEAIEKEEERLEKDRLRFSYKNRGKYVTQLKRFAKYFPRNQMLVLITEDLKQDPYDVLKRIYEFLGVDTNFKNSLTVERNKGGAPRLWWLQRMKQNISNIYIRKAIDVLNLKSSYPPMKPETREMLIKFF